MIILVCHSNSHNHFVMPCRGEKHYFRILKSLRDHWPNWINIYLVLSCENMCVRCENIPRYYSILMKPLTSGNIKSNSWPQRLENAKNNSPAKTIDFTEYIDYIRIINIIKLSIYNVLVRIGLKCVCGAVNVNYIKSHSKKVQVFRKLQSIIFPQSKENVLFRDTDFRYVNEIGPRAQCWWLLTVWSCSCLVPIPGNRAHRSWSVKWINLRS